MAGFIGARASVVSSGAERKQTYAITTTTTSLTGLAYTPTKVHVFHNGIRLVDGTDYTATDGSTITLTTAAQNGDEVVVISYATFQTSDTVSAANGGTFAGNVAMSGTLDVTGAVTAASFVGDGSALTGISSTPASTVIYVAQNTAPTGYLKANGAAISRTTYADLFAAIGTTFDLPDLRGEFLRGWDDARGIDSGRTFGSAQADQFKLHGHPYRQANQSSISNDASGGAIMTDSNGAHANRAAYTGTPANANTQAIGGEGGSETRPRNIALLACIKY